MDLFLPGHRQIRTAGPLGSGVQGAVYAVEGDPQLAVKVVTSPTKEYEQRLRTMIAQAPPSDTLHKQGAWDIAWPLDLVFDGPDRRLCVGFSMKKVVNKRLYFDLRQELTTNSITNEGFCADVALNLVSAVNAAHSVGFVLCDLNDRNLMVSRNDWDASVALIDCDSWQVPAKGKMLRSSYCCAEFLPHELQGKNLSKLDRTPNHDEFSLGALVFELLNGGHHAFATNYVGAGNGPTIAERIRNGWWPHASVPNLDFLPRTDAPPFSRLPPLVQQAFTRCFEYGFSDPCCRLSAAEWLAVLAANREALAGMSRPTTTKRKVQQRFAAGVLAVLGVNGGQLHQFIPTRKRLAWQFGTAVCLAAATLAVGAALRWRDVQVSNHSAQYSAPWVRPRISDVQPRGGTTPVIWWQLAHEQDP